MHPLPLCVCVRALSLLCLHISVSRLQLSISRAHCFHFPSSFRKVSMKFKSVVLQRACVRVEGRLYGNCTAVLLQSAVSYVVSLQCCHRFICRWLSDWSLDGLVRWGHCGAVKHFLCLFGTNKDSIKKPHLMTFHLFVTKKLKLQFWFVPLTPHSHKHVHSLMMPLHYTCRLNVCIIRGVAFWLAGKAACSC